VLHEKDDHKNQLVNGWGLCSMKHMKDVPNVFCNDAAYQFQDYPSVLVFEITQEISKLVKLLNLSRKVKL